VAKKKAKHERREVPEADHLARHCNSQRVIRDPTTREIKGVWPEAFELRTKLEEEYLSTHWMEYFSRDDIDTQFQYVVQALRAKRDVKANSAIARLKARLVVEAGKSRGHPIRIRDRSSATNPGYAGIYNMPRDNSDRELLAVLANECCIQIRGVDAIDATV
jgi:hypothetical protein